MSGKTQYDASNEMVNIIINSLCGSVMFQKKIHISRAKQIAKIIWCRWHLMPKHWKQKHIKWYFENKTTYLSPKVRYAHYRTMVKILFIMDKSHWLGYLPVKYKKAQ